MILGCGSSETETAADGQTEDLPTLAAEVLQLDPAIWPQIARAQGNVLADEVSVVGAKVAGRVAEVHVDLGDLVRAGDPLVTLDQDEFTVHVEQAEAQYAQACAAVGLKPGDPVSRLNPEQAPPVRQERAMWDEAKANLKRSQQLHSQNAISAAELEQFAAAERVAEARYASALNGVHEKIALIGVRAAELDLARQRHRDATVRAPYDGQVQQRAVAPGAYVQVGADILTMVRSNPLRFRGSLPERYAQRLAVGQSVELQVESVPQPRQAKVTRISPSLDALSRGLLFEAEIDNSDGALRAGLFAEAEVVLNPTARALVIPQSALHEFAGAEKVWKVVDGTAGEQVVRTGRRRDGRVEVLDGLAPGDTILLDASVGRIARIRPANDASLAASPRKVAKTTDARAEAETSGAAAGQSE